MYRIKNFRFREYRESFIEILANDMQRIDGVYEKPQLKEKKPDFFFLL